MLGQGGQCCLVGGDEMHSLRAQLVVDGGVVAQLQRKANSGELSWVHGPSACESRVQILHLVIKNVLEGAGIGADARAEIHLLAFLLQLQVLEGLLVAGVGVEVVQVQQVRACRCLEGGEIWVVEVLLQLEEGRLHDTRHWHKLESRSLSPQALGSSSSFDADPSAAEPLRSFKLAEPSAPQLLSPSALLQPPQTPSPRAPQSLSS
mmetsp:Transcript_44943/g.70453  ORF Transcript_44943/g.70453 Transcript_44943/m.70453 type:complete len:206 (+) Transcript_44943:857-1474(+)